MKLTNKILREWEMRIPDLYGKWTHWKLLGDRQTIGVIEGDHLLEVMELLQKSYGKYDKVKIVRVSADDYRNIIEEETMHETVIYIYADIEIELGHKKDIYKAT